MNCHLLQLFILNSKLFQQMHVAVKDFSASCQLLGQGAEYAAAAKSQYTTLLFLLSKGMVGVSISILVFM